MHNVTRFVTAALAAAVLTLLAAMPLVAAWRTPAEQPAAPASISPIELLQQDSDLPASCSRAFRWSTEAATAQRDDPRTEATRAGHLETAGSRRRRGGRHVLPSAVRNRPHHAQTIPRNRYGRATQKTAADVGLRHRWPGQPRPAGSEGRRSRPPSRRLWRHRRALRFRWRCVVMDAGTGPRSRLDAARGGGVDRSLSPAVGHHAQRRGTRPAATKRVARSVRGGRLSAGHPPAFSAASGSPPDFA